MSISNVHFPMFKCIRCLRENKWVFVTIYLIFLTSSPSSTYSSINCLFLMESLKAIPLLYKRKVKFTLLTFDSYISLAHPTMIFFAYTVSGQWATPSYRMSWPSVGTAAVLLCLRFGASLVLLRFDGRPCGAGLFANINDLASWTENSRCCKTFRFWMPSSLQCLRWKIQPFTLLILMRCQKTLMN